MPVNRAHLEFHTVDLDTGFETVPGYPEGFKQKILTGFLDEENKQGGRTRLLKIEAGSFTTEPFVHDYWEEVFQVSGDLVVDGESFGPNTYACRPPGAWHGPFRSETGCLLLESHYYDESATG